MKSPMGKEAEILKSQKTFIYDTRTNICECYEIKHSSERSEKQYRHFTNEDFVAATEKKLGKITKRCVLYKGETFIEEKGVEYKNVEEYLCEL